MSVSESKETRDETQRLIGKITLRLWDMLHIYDEHIRGDVDYEELPKLLDFLEEEGDNQCETCPFVCSCNVKGLPVKELTQLNNIKIIDNMPANLLTYDNLEECFKFCDNYSYYWQKHIWKCASE